MEPLIETSRDGVIGVSTQKTTTKFILYLYKSQLYFYEDSKTLCIVLHRYREVCQHRIDLNKQTSETNIISYMKNISPILK